MNMEEQKQYCEKYGLKKYHILMRVEHGGSSPNPEGFAEDLRGELEISVFAANEAQAEHIAYDAYKIACRDVDYVEVDSDYEDDEDEDGFCTKPVEQVLESADEDVIPCES
jgi:hypothetical protein